VPQWHKYNDEYEWMPHYNGKFTVKRNMGSHLTYDIMTVAEIRLQDEELADHINSIMTQVQ